MAPDDTTDGGPANPARGRLLDGAVELAARRGISDLSLRQVAAELGTSHRMLIYHFGSREGLLVEIVREVEARQRAVRVPAAPPGGSGEVGAEIRASWRAFSDPALAGWERLFFELYGQALQGRPGTTGLLDGVVESWTIPIAAELRSRGVPRRDATPMARLMVAVMRGLLLDLLATGDRRGVDRALEAFIALVTAAAPQ